MMRRLLTIFVFLIMVSSITALSEEDITITPIKDQITLEESGQFLISIESKESTIFETRVYSPDVEWNIPQINIKVYPYKISNEKIIVTPTKYISPGLKGIKLNFKEVGRDTLIQKVFFINVKPPGEAYSNYVPSVVITPSMSKKAIPGQEFNILIEIQNQNVLVLDELILRIRSDLESLNTDQNVSLGPVTGDEGKKIIDLSYALDILTKPGTYEVSFELVKDKEIIESVPSQSFTIPSTTPAYLEKLESESSFLKTTNIITFTSQSNIEDAKAIKIKSGLLKRLFTETSVPSEIIEEDGKKFISFNLALAPGEIKVVTVTTNYRVPLILLIAAIIGLFLYQKYKSPIIIKKNITETRINEGGISKIKIVLEIKSISKKPIKNLTVVDYIPNISDISKEFIEGTLRPSQMLLHKKKGTILKWHINEIAPGEERLISYETHSKLSIIGNFRLPRAKVIFKRNKKEVHSYSNSVGVNA